MAGPVIKPGTTGSRVRHTIDCTTRPGQSRPHFRRASFSREAKRKTKKLFPFEKMLENMEMQSFTLITDLIIMFAVSKKEDNLRLLQTALGVLLQKHSQQPLVVTELIDLVSLPYFLSLTLKVPNKNCSRQHFNFLLLSFEENKARCFK